MPNFNQKSELLLLLYLLLSTASFQCDVFIAFWIGNVVFNNVFVKEYQGVIYNTKEQKKGFFCFVFVCYPIACDKAYCKIRY